MILILLLWYRFINNSFIHSFFLLHLLYIHCDHQIQKFFLHSPDNDIVFILNYKLNIFWNVIIKLKKN